MSVKYRPKRNYAPPLSRPRYHWDIRGLGGWLIRLVLFGGWSAAIAWTGYRRGVELPVLIIMSVGMFVFLGTYLWIARPEVRRVRVKESP